jgi:predicted CXXCH cytochrome family protein
MKLRLPWNKNTLIFGITAAWSLLMISCVVANRTAVPDSKIAGATLAGSKQCAQCHSEITDHFGSASHNRTSLADGKVGDTGCESCHGPASAHVKAGGGKGTIINPRKSPEACFSCHQDKRGQFSLPNSHPVLSGKVSCVDCHNVHAENSIKGSGASLEGPNETCTKCHVSQKGPYVFEHNATKEGCTACHNPHGSVNAKMLVARDANLCLSCHLQTPVATAAAQGQLNVNAIAQGGHAHNSDVQRGTCWSSGCHEAPHGSNTDNLFRR